MSGQVRLEVEEGVAVLTLDRPDKRNALSNVMLSDLATHLEAIAADDTVRVVVVTGAGPEAFCAGRDMTEAAGGADGQQRNVNPFSMLLDLEKPTIAALHGYVYGGGTLLALMCDIRIAEPSTRFRFVGASYGLVVGAAMLSTLVGPSRAKDIIYTCRVVESDEAREIGLVNRLVDADARTAAIDMGKEIAKQSTSALAGSKVLINEAAETTRIMERESEVNRNLRGEADQVRRFSEATKLITGKSV